MSPVCPSLVRYARHVCLPTPALEVGSKADGSFDTGPFVAGARAAQAAGAVVSTLETVPAPFARVRAGIEVPIGAIPVAVVGTAREVEDGKLEAIKDGRGPRMGKKHSMPLPDWF